MIKLYGYYRSSASYRVRIALNLKGLPYELVPIHLIKDGGQQLLPAYREINADGLVPALIDDTPVGIESVPLTQSLAIIEYLEELYPEPPLLPSSPADRAFVRAQALSIACDIHPVNNLRILRYLSRNLHVEEADRDTWYRHWCEQGLQALETTLSRDKRVGRCCFGDTPGIADCCLIPQIYNARRYHSDLSAMPTLMRIHDYCMTLDAFAKAVPENQPDAA